MHTSFVEYFAAYLKKLLSNKTETITAEQFQEQVTSAVNDYLKKHYNIDANGVRSAIAQSTPEAECANAIKARSLHGIGEDVSISHYKTQAEISKASYTTALATVKELYRLADNNERGLVIADWTSSTNISLPDMRLGKDGIPVPQKKRQETVQFEPTSAVNCGQCWICKTDVMSYSGPSINKYINDIQNDNGNPIECTTPCGDCEHVSAVMASYIAGMLKSAGFSKYYWASYYVACVECNRKKSNYIGVKLTATKGWEVDETGIDAILYAIFPLAGDVNAHGSEYNPIRNALTTKYNTMPPDEKHRFRDEVRSYIVEGTRTWCAAANDKLYNEGKPKPIRMAFNVSRIIVAIIGHLEIIMGPLQKKTKRTKTATRLGQGPKLESKKGGGPRIALEGEYVISNSVLTNAEDDVVKELEQFKETVATSLNNENTEKTEKTEKTDDAMEADEDMGLEEEEIYRNALIEAFLEKVKTDYAPKILVEYNLGTEDFIDLIDNLLGSMAEITGISDPPSPAQPLPAAASSATANRYPHAKAFVADTGSRLKLIAAQKLEPLTIPQLTNANDDDDDELGKINFSNAFFVSIDGNDVSRPSSGKRSNTEVDGDKRTPTGKRLTPGSRTPIAHVSDDGSLTDTSENETDETDALSVPGLPVVYSNEEDSQRAAADRSVSSTPIIPPLGGKRLNKRNSKKKSQTHNKKNRTKRISYIKHKQTRKNKHSRKTKSKRSNKK